MKVLINTLFGLILSLFAVSSVWSQVSEQHDPLLVSVSRLAADCSLQTYNVGSNGRKVYAPLKSICQEVKVRGNQARLKLNGETFYATVTESENSDGGDLDNLVIRNASGDVVAQRFDVPSFGDVLLALVGGETNFRTELDPSIAVR